MIFLNSKDIYIFYVCGRNKEHVLETYRRGKRQRNIPLRR